MAERRTARRPLTRVRDGAAVASIDTMAVEEPLEVRVDGTPVSVTMRTPGDDFDLALGFVLTEGLLDRADDVAAIRHCEGPGTDAADHNVVDVRRRVPAPVDEALRRTVYTTSSCGICGTASIDGVRARARGSVANDPVTVPAAVLTALPDRLRERQRVFDRTGGLHAAGLFTADGELVCLREDVGRHNAVDKVIGRAAAEHRLPLSGHVLMVSGRVAFEIAAKALWAGVPVVAAVSAPSSLAVDLAADAGMTLVGFLRGSSMNVYARPDRVIGPVVAGRQVPPAGAGS